MATDRHTRITIETERILIIARQRAARDRCKECGRELEPLPFDRARNPLDATAGSGEEHPQDRFHPWPVPVKDGLIFVCLRLLLRFLQLGSGPRNS
jgi:hypothetical protein